MATPAPAVASASLMLAIVLTSTTPIMLLDRDLRIVAASSSFCSAFDVDPAAIVGCLLPELGAGEWDVPQLISGLTSAISGNSSIEGYEMLLQREGQDSLELVLNAHRLEYGEG